jgi:hypothetical protein
MLFALATLFLSFAPQISSGTEVKPIPLVLTRINETFYEATAALAGGPFKPFFGLSGRFQLEASEGCFFCSRVL